MQPTRDSRCDNSRDVGMNKAMQEHLGVQPLNELHRPGLPVRCDDHVRRTTNDFLSESPLSPMFLSYCRPRRVSQATRAHGSVSTSGVGNYEHAESHDRRNFCVAPVLQRSLSTSWRLSTFTRFCGPGSGFRVVRASRDRRTSSRRQGQGSAHRPCVQRRFE